MFSLERQKSKSTSNPEYLISTLRMSLDSSLVCTCCEKIKEEYQQKINKLKQKAHQSFMQLMQMQRLHEEELNLAREQYQKKQKNLLHLNQELEYENIKLKQQSQLFELNFNRHSFDIQFKQSIFDNVETIYSPNNQRSYLDESQMYQFKQLITSKSIQQTNQNYFQHQKIDQKKNIRSSSKKQKLFYKISEIKRQNENLQKVLNLIKQQSQNKEIMISQLKQQIQKYKRQSIFLQQHVKKLASQKLSLQKKIRLLQKQQSKKYLSPSMNSSSVKIQPFMNSSLKIESSKDYINQQNYLNVSNSRTRRQSIQIEYKQASQSIKRYPLKNAINNNIKQRTLSKFII